MSAAKDIAERLELTLDNTIEHAEVQQARESGLRPVVVLEWDDWSQLIVDASRAVGYLGAES